MSSHSERPPAPIKAPERRIEAATEAQNSAAQFFEATLLGIPPKEGLCARIERAANLDELRGSLATEVSRIAHDANALALFGHPDALKAGLHAYESAEITYVRRYKTLFAEATVAGLAPRNYTSIEQSQKVTLALRFANKLIATHSGTEELTAPIKRMTVVEYLKMRTTFEGDSNLWKEVLSPYFILKARLHAYVVEHHLQNSLSEEEAEVTTRGIEINHFNYPIMFIWEDFLRLPDCTDSEYEDLAARFETFIPRAEALHAEFRAFKGDAPLEWVKAFSAYETDWMRFILDAQGKVEI